MSDLYRKKPIPYEARQLLGSEDGQTGCDLATWCGGSLSGTFAEPKLFVPTLEGELVARVGDWVVKGTHGEFWPVRGDFFAETYEAVDTPSTGAPITYAGHTWQSAYEWCLWIMQHNAAPGPAQNGQRAALDAYRAEVRAEALHEATDAAESEAARLYNDWGQRAAGGARAVAELLRQMTDQAQTAAPVPLIVTRYDTASEPAPEEEPILTVGAIAEDGRPVALLFDEETRAKVAGWLAPDEADRAELERLRARLGRGPVQTQALTDQMAELQEALDRCRAAAFVALALALREEPSYDLATKLEDLGELALTGEPDEVAVLVGEISELAGIDEVTARLGTEIPYESPVDEGREKGSREADATPDFFQPDHTYERGRWQFQCHAVAPTPWNGEVWATGFLSRRDGTGSVAGMGVDDWGHGGWRDIADPSAEGGDT